MPLLGEPRPRRPIQQLARRPVCLLVERKAQMAITNNAAGLAALLICESLLLTLSHLNIVGRKDMRDLLMDVITTHREAGNVAKKPKIHQAVVEIVQGILAGKGWS